MTERKELETTIKALDDILSHLEKVRQAAETTAAKLRDSFGSMKTLKEHEKILNGITTERESDRVASAADFLKSGLAYELDLIAKNEQQKTELMAYYSKMRIDDAAKEISVLVANAKIHQWAEEGRARIVGAAYDAMGQEMLNFVERDEFSTAEFGKIIIQQVKMELVGLAAKAAVYAIYETAVALAASTGWFGVTTFGEPAGHWASAATFASIAGVSLAAAYGVQNVIQGGREESKDGASGGSGASARSPRGASSLSWLAAAPVSLSSEAQPRQTQHITIQIYNPLSEQNWEKIAEQDIIPAINSAVNRNVVLTVR